MTVSVDADIMLPRIISELTRAQWAMSALSAALKLGLFDVIDEGADTFEDIAERLSSSKKGVELLVNALCGMKLLEHDKSSRIRLSKEAESYLLTSSPLFLGKYIELQPELTEHWKHLDDSVRSGKSVTEVNRVNKAEEFFPELAAALFGKHYRLAEAVAHELTKRLGKTGDLAALDLACGSCVWSIPLAKAAESNRVDALDFPAVLETARLFVEKNDVSEQYQYLVGDWREAELVPESYDVVYLGHILHSEGVERSRQMLAEMNRCMKPGGWLVIAEFLVDDSRCLPSQSSLFALNMYILTSSGCVFSRNGMTKMLEDSGFDSVVNATGDDGDSMVLLARKA